MDEMDEVNEERGWKWKIVDESGWKWMKVDESGWKEMEVDEIYWIGSRPSVTSGEYYFNSGRFHQRRYWHNAVMCDIDGKTPGALPNLSQKYHISSSDSPL